jgi:predicted nuclease of predicted toxin-antitoxin system
VVIVADENVDLELIRLLRISNFDVISIAETSSGISDVAVLEIANSLKALLITEDTDFGDLIFKHKHKHSGILLLRFSHLPRLERIDTSLKLIEASYLALLNEFSVFSKQGLRKRK